MFLYYSDAGRLISQYYGTVGTLHNRNFKIQCKISFLTI